MVDTRFHPAAAPRPLAALLAGSRIAAQCEEAAAARLTVFGAEELVSAGVQEIALAAHKHYLDDLRMTAAAAVVVSEELREHVPPGSLAVVTARPHELFADLLDQIYPGGARRHVTATAVAGSTPQLIEEDVLIGPNVVLGEGVELGRNTVIGANTVIGPGVAIGRNCVIASGCSIECAYLGNNVIVHPGVRIGCEGFGWLDLGRSNRKIPQLGRVIVQDGVEIGANSTIDRGALGDTVIGEGSKVDNLVQIGHNCRIGRNCLIAAQSGLSGSTTLEDGVLLGGGAGTGGHLTIGEGSVVYGRAGVSKSWPAGSKLFGAPARDIKEYWREAAMLRRMSKKDQR
jgi:UDP-3-O-[3-hydroxymyristoyl] glucosamine N-acyltransferase